MRFSGKRVLVTGATGFLGGYLALRLADEGAAVRALARDPEKCGRLSHKDRIEIVTGDIRDLRRMREASAGCDYVFHCAAMTATIANLNKQRVVTVGGTRNVARAAAENDVERLVHVSSIGVYGLSMRGDITEDLAYGDINLSYAITKIEAEHTLQTVAAQSTLSYSIIRPAFIYGPLAKTWTRRLFMLARIKPTPFLGDGSGSAHPIHVDDVVDMMLTLARHPAAAGQAFNCAPDPTPTWREYLGHYARLAGHQNWLGLPVAPLSGIARALAALTGSKSVLQDGSDALSWFQRRFSYKMTKAADLLGWQPKIDLRSGIESCAPWLREQGLLR